MIKIISPAYDLHRCVGKANLCQLILTLLDGTSGLYSQTILRKLSRILVTLLSEYLRMYYLYLMHKLAFQNIG